MQLQEIKMLETVSNFSLGYLIPTLVFVHDLSNDTVKLGTGSIHYLLIENYIISMLIYYCQWVS